MAKRASTAWHAGVRAASVEAAVWPDLDLRLERAAGVLPVVQRHARAAQTLQLQKSIRQKTHRRMVVEAGPGAAFEVVQSQFLFELLIALLHMPAALPDFDGVEHRRLRWQVRQRIANRPVAAPFHQQPARFGLAIWHVVGGPPVLPSVRWPDAQPGELRL